ncbi:ABC transporter B family member 15-like [Telopea speciosissima]|uniref:ABC transporter B family member 15-like n=1 Tax=Telopea speciosissima TaxID=54955 RepID=UPI001CC6570C|nr:ABC transporter B family member 15-like [Telopea speciosissima]
MRDSNNNKVVVAAKGKKKQSKKGMGSLRTVFMHADAIDICLMALGIIGAVGDGVSLPALFYVNSLVFNSFGSATTGNSSFFVNDINRNVLILIYLACACYVVAFFEGYCWARTGERQATRMRARYLKAVLRQDVSYFDLKEGSMTDVVSSVSDDTLVIQDFLSEKVPRILANFAGFVGCYVVAFVLMWNLAIVGFPFIVLLIVPGFVCGRIMMSLATKMRTEYNKAGSIAQQAISSIRTVYSFVGENKIMSEFSEALQGSVELGLKQGLAKGFAIGSNGIMISIWAFMAWYGSTLIMYHNAKGGTIFAVGLSVLFGGMSLGSALMNIKYLSEAMSAGDRIMGTIKRVPEIDSENMEGQILENVLGEVEFKNIEFAYPSRPESIIFKDLCLKIPAGRTVALVGGSGSGKSTVISLLERFYNPLEGEILVDGVAINKLQLKWFRSQMGLVSQEPALFATSVKENILFGNEDATMDEIIAAAKAANAHNFVSQLPQGYETQVGEAGLQISGGQKQRLAIARAIIKSPKILLLDEATSALDSESERIVQEALDKVMIGRTTIVVAHRLSTIRNADMIAVVQNGQVMETGTHEELMQDENGLYTALVRNQQTETKSKDETQIMVSSSSLHLSREDGNNSSSRRRSSINKSITSNAKSKVGMEVTQVEVIKEEEIPIPSFRRLLLLNLPEWKQAAIGCTSAALYGAVQPVQSFLMGSMISVFFLTDYNEMKIKTTAYALAFAGLGFFSILVNVSQHYNFAAMGENMTKRIRERMLSQILTFEVGWFDQDTNSTGAVCSRLAKDANTVRSLVGDRMSLLLQSFSSVVVACTVGLIISWKLAVVLIAIQPLLVVSHYIRRVLLQQMTKKALKTQDESSKLAAEAVSNHRTITVFSSQDRILRLLAEAEEGPRKESIRQAWFAGILLGASQSMLYFTRAFEFWYGGQLLLKGEVTATAFFEAFFILVSLGRVIADAGSMTSDLSKGTEAVASVFAVLDRKTRIETDDPEGFQPEKLTGHVELRDVDFSYPARPDVVIFRGFSINIRPGKSTALVGHSGSGKSTIIGLIDRFYDPLKGTVEIDGRNIRSYNLKALRKHIALVSQEPTLFAKTIRENILFGISDQTVGEAEIVEAAKAANAHDFITALKDGYDTFCGEKGTQLSGGQKQRIAIARAILKNPAILLLDEATSALDTQSEKVVQEALERLMVGRTSVVVAHRLSTIQNCDLIAVLDKGKVVEKGTHSSLLAKGPTSAYYSLVNIQRAAHMD